MAAAEVVHGANNSSVAVDLIREFLSIIQSEVEGSEFEGWEQSRYQVPMITGGTLGRSKFSSPRNQLAFYKPDFQFQKLQKFLVFRSELLDKE